MAFRTGGRLSEQGVAGDDRTDRPPHAPLRTRADARASQCPECGARSPRHHGGAEAARPGRRLRGAKEEPANRQGADRGVAARTRTEVTMNLLRLAALAAFCSAPLSLAFAQPASDPLEGLWVSQSHWSAGPSGALTIKHRGAAWTATLGTNRVTVTAQAHDIRFSFP